MIRIPVRALACRDLGEDIGLATVQLESSLLQTIAAAAAAAAGGKRLVVVSEADTMAIGMTAESCKHRVYTKQSLKTRNLYHVLCTINSQHDAH